MLLSLVVAAPGVRADAATLTYSWPANIGPLNPHRYSPNELFAQHQVYEGLVRIAANGSIQPWLASDWSISEDGRIYTFSLREDVRFSDGTPFNADAVVANFNAVLNRRENHDWLGLIAAIDRVEATQTHEVAIHLTGPYYPILPELALIRPVRFIAPSAMPEDGDTWSGMRAPVGTGPWQLVESRRGVHYILESNPYYWGEAPGHERLEIKVISDPTARAIALQTGEIDLIYGAGSSQIAPDTFIALAADPAYETAISPPLASRVLALNSGRAPTDQRAVRQAIVHAVDTALIAERILNGLEPPGVALFADSVPYADIGLEQYGFDPERSAALLEDAGWRLGEDGLRRNEDGTVLSVELCFVGTNPTQKAIAEVTQAYLRDVGIEARLIGEEQSAFYERQRNGTFHLIFGDTWGAPYDPHAFVSSMRVPSHADYQAQSGLEQKPQIDAAIAEVLASTDEGERQRLYDYILRTLHEEAIYLPISYLTATYVHRPGLEGVNFGPTRYEIDFAAMRPASAE